MADPSGFAWQQRKSGEIVIRHEGRLAATLRGEQADRFRRQVTDDPAQGQHLMARATGNYKRGNERAARA